MLTTISSFLRWVAGLTRSHPLATRWLVGGGLTWVALCFALGYRLPAFDRHPAWRGFPAVDNPYLVVEEIPDSLFGPRYSHRFPYPREAAMVVRRGTLVGMDPDSTVEITSGYVVRNGWLVGRDSAADIEITSGWELYDDYRRNLKNIHSVGFQVTENNFDSGIHIRLWSGGNDVGRPGEPWSPGFRKFGYEYLQLRLGDVSGYFKDQQSSESTALDGFYQYNRPASRRDTLYLRYGPNNTNYRVYVSDRPRQREREWAVTNHAREEVQFTVRYLLDSLPLTKAGQVIFKKAHRFGMPVDAAGRARGWGAIDHLAQHSGQWYRVFAVGRVDPLWGPGPRNRVEAYNLSAGVVTYWLPPHSSQVLLRTPVLRRRKGGLPWESEPAPPIASLWIRGEGLYTVRWRGDQLHGLFRPDQSVQEYDLAAPDRLLFTVGPKLQPELGLWGSCKHAFYDLFNI